MTSNLQVLVSGATGTQGGAVARELLARGHRVRALTRNPQADTAVALAGLGADVAAGDFDDVESLSRAAAGVDAVFVMGTPFGTDPETETRQSIALIDAAAKRQVPHIVYSSVASALDATGIPHFESKALVEQHLSGLDGDHTVVAPSAFLVDLVSPWMLPSLLDGRYTFALPGDLPLQQVAVADIAAFVGLVVEDRNGFAGQRIELASVETTGDGVAARLSAWLERTVTYNELPLEVVRQQMGDDGVRMIEFFRRGGYTIDIPALHRAYPQVKWHDVDSWIREHDWSGVR
ncbi:MAG: NmrA/HSCARG family protein [Nocardioidaceae bacterium]